MKTETFEPQIGQVIYADSRYHGLKKLTIERFTKTTAILSDGTKLRLPLSQDYQSAIGASGYSTPLYRISSDEIDKRYLKQILLSRIKKLAEDELENYPITKLQAILNALEN